MTVFTGSTYVSDQTKTCNGMDRNQPVDFKECSFSFNVWSFTHNDRYVYMGMVYKLVN